MDQKSSTSATMIVLTTKRLSLLAALFLAGCKLSVVSLSGGEITSLANGTCASGSICDIPIDERSFDETFTAVPAFGYTFLKWQDGFACGGSTSPECRVNFASILNNPQLENPEGLVDGIIASKARQALMPVYTPSASDIDGDGVFDRLDDDIDGDGLANDIDPCPIDYFKLPGQCIQQRSPNVVNGKVWAWPSLFNGVSKYELLQACPQGVCEDDAVLNGYNLRGWRWATYEDMRELLGSYGIPLLEFARPVLQSTLTYTRLFADLGGLPPVQSTVCEGTCERWLDGWLNEGLENELVNAGAYYNRPTQELGVGTTCQFADYYEEMRRVYEDWVGTIYFELYRAITDINVNDFCENYDIPIPIAGVEHNLARVNQGPSGVSDINRGAWLYRPEGELNL